MPRYARRIRSESRSCSPITQSARGRDDRASSPVSPPSRRRRTNSSPPSNSPPRTRSTRQLEERIRELEAAVAANTQPQIPPSNETRSQNQTRNGVRTEQQRGRQRTRWVMFGLNIPIGDYTPMCRVHREVACTHCIYFVTNRPYPQLSQMAIED